MQHCLWNIHHVTDVAENPAKHILLFKKVSEFRKTGANFYFGEKKRGK